LSVGLPESFLLLSPIKKYYAISGEQEDLISIGTIGLIKAASTFDYDRCKKFSTYASKCIQNAILSKTLFWRRPRGSVSLKYPKHQGSRHLACIMMHLPDLYHTSHDRPGLPALFPVYLTPRLLEGLRLGL
jgi:hypothetical protein